MEDAKKRIVVGIAAIMLYPMAMGLDMAVWGYRPSYLSFNLECGLEVYSVWIRPVIDFKKEGCPGGRIDIGFAEKMIPM